MSDVTVLRDFARAPFTQAVTYYEWDRPRQAAGAEISASGIYLRTTEPLQVGSLLTLRLQLPGGPAFTVLGRVARSIRPAFGSLAQAGMGIRFLDISAAGRDAIAGYVAGRLQLLCA